VLSQDSAVQVFAGLPICQFADLPICRFAYLLFRR
jgi:hypothetical protein